jgi:hypothetical protein
MLTESLIRQQLYQGAETKNLDYKAGFDWNVCSSETRLGLIKDILGMSNTQDGGVLLIGVDDSSFEVTGLTALQIDSFDQTRLGDQVRRYSDPPCTIQLYKVEVDNKNIVAIEAREFNDVPHLCKTNGNSSTSGKNILRRGALYIRTDRATTEEISTAEDMRSLLGRALKARGDSIISSMRALLAGSPPAQPAPIEFDRQIKEGAEFVESLDFAGEDKWILTSHPANFDADRIADTRDMVKRLERSKVSLRGWNFPRLRSDDISNFGEGVESSFSGKPLAVMHKEGFRAYSSGLFLWTGVFWEDGEPRSSGRKDLTFIGAIWQHVEFFLFLSRYFDFLEDEEGVDIRIEASGLRDRELTARDARLSWSGGYIARADSFIFKKTVRAVELKGAPMDFALECSRRFMLLFNWNTVTDQVIKDWQQRLLNRNF